MTTKLPFSKSKSNSTDEDYESDDSEIEKLKTKLVDPVEDKELIEELLTTSKTSFAFGSEGFIRTDIIRMLHVLGRNR